MTVKVIAITTVNPREPEALQEYLSRVAPLIESVGAKMLERYETQRTIVGNSMPQFVTLMEYPDEYAVEKVFGSDEYAGLKEVRHKAFTHYQIALVS